MVLLLTRVRARGYRVITSQIAFATYVFVSFRWSAALEFLTIPFCVDQAKITQKKLIGNFNSHIDSCFLKLSRYRRNTL